MKPVQDMDRVDGFFANDLHVGFPHVAANRFDIKGTGLAEHPEKPQQGLGFPVFSNPKKPSAKYIYLINQSQIRMSRFILNLIDSNALHIIQATMRKAIRHHILNGMPHRVPGHPKNLSCFFPRQPLGPTSQENPEGIGQMAFTIGPGKPFNFCPTTRTIDSSRPIAKLNLKTPQRDKQKSSLFQMIVNRTLFQALRAQTLAVLSGKNIHNYLQTGFFFFQPGVAVNKALEFVTLV